MDYDKRKIIFTVIFVCLFVFSLGLAKNSAQAVELSLGDDDAEEQAIEQQEKPIEEEEEIEYLLGETGEALEAQEQAKARQIEEEKKAAEDFDKWLKENKETGHEGYLGTMATNTFLDYAGFNVKGLKIKEGQDIRLYVVNLIKIVLTLVGFGFFILIFIGGYMWLTAAGNEETIKKAKSIITKAIVGFVIILVSYALAVFVVTALVSSLQSATA